MIFHIGYRELALPVAVAVLPGNRGVFEGESHVVGNEQVKISIPVIIQKAASGSPPLLIAP